MSKKSKKTVKRSQVSSKGAAKAPGTRQAQPATSDGGDLSGQPGAAGAGAGAGGEDAGDDMEYLEGFARWFDAEGGVPPVAARAEGSPETAGDAPEESAAEAGADGEPGADAEPDADAGDAGDAVGDPSGDTAREPGDAADGGKARGIERVCADSTLACLETGIEPLDDSPLELSVPAVAYGRVEDVPCVKGFVRLCEDGWRMGWHEGTAGGLSYRMGARDVLAFRPFIVGEAGAWVALAEAVPSLARAVFMVTGSGCAMRNVAADPAANIGIVQVDGTGASWRAVWGLGRTGRPMDEFETHLACHAARAKQEGGAQPGAGQPGAGLPGAKQAFGPARVVYHAHVPNLMAAALVLPEGDAALTRALWKAMPSGAAAFPEGVGAVSRAQAAAGAAAHPRPNAPVARKMASLRAVEVPGDGLYCSGADFDEAFGLMHSVEKAAEVYRFARQMGRADEPADDGAALKSLRAIAAAHRALLNEPLFVEGEGAGEGEGAVSRA